MPCESFFTTEQLSCPSDHTAGEVGAHGSTHAQSVHSTAVTRQCDGRATVNGPTMCKSSVATRKLIGELRPQPLHGVDLIAKHSALAALRRRAERIEIGLIGRLAKSHHGQAEVARAVAEIQDADGGLQLCRR